MHKMGVGCALHFLGKGELHESGLDEIPGVFRTSATADFRNPKEKISRGLPQFCGSPVPFLPLHFSLFTLHSSLPPPLPFVGRYALHAGDLSIILSASIPAFLCRKKAQRKAIKRNAKGRSEKGGFLKKSPFKSPKNFWATGAGKVGAHSGNRRKAVSG